MVLDRLCEKDPDKSHKLLTRKLPTWHEQDLFSLAKDVGQGDFVNNKCCQTKLDKIWLGKTGPTTSVFTVSVDLFLIVSYGTLSYTVVDKIDHLDRYQATNYFRSWQVISLLFALQA